MSVKIRQVKTIKFGFMSNSINVSVKELTVTMNLDNTDMIESDMTTVTKCDLVTTHYTPTLIAGLIIDSYREKLFDLLKESQNNKELDSSLSFTKILSIHPDKMSTIAYDDKMKDLSYEEIIRQYPHICHTTNVIFTTGTQSDIIYSQLKSIFTECLLSSSLMETHRKNVFELFVNFNREANGHMPSMNPFNEATDKTPNNTLGDKSKFVSVETQFGTEIDVDPEADIESDADAEIFSAITKINLDIPIKLDSRFRLSKASSVSYDVLDDYPELIVNQDVTKKELTLDYLHQQLVKVLCVQRELDGYCTLINMAIREHTKSNDTLPKTENGNS